MSRQDAAEKHSQMPMSLQQISGKKSMSQQQIPESKNTIINEHVTSFLKTYQMM